MKKTLLLVAFVFGIALTGIAKGDTPLQPLEILSLDLGETAYVVEDGEATINNEMIKRIAVGQEKITAAYRNRTEETKRPLYSVELYNQYGLLLGGVRTGQRTFGGPGYIDPDDVGTERLHVQWLPLDRIFKKSDVTLPDGWKTVKWVVVKDENPKTSRDDEGHGH